MRSTASIDFPSSPSQFAAYRVQPALTDIEVHPYHTWLKGLAFGAVFGVLGMIFEATWNILILTARMGGQSNWRKLATWSPFSTLAVVAFTWVATFVLTAEEPTLDARRGILSRSLRWFVTASFLLSSALVLNLFEGLPRSIRTDVIEPTRQIASIFASLLLLIHVRALSVRLGFNSLVWRSSIALLAIAFAASLQYVPMFVPIYDYRRHGSGWHFVNFQCAVYALAATIAALVYIRMFVSVLAEWMRDSGRELPTITSVVKRLFTRRGARQSVGNAPVGSARSGG